MNRPSDVNQRNVYQVIARKDTKEYRKLMEDPDNRKVCGKLLEAGLIEFSAEYPFPEDLVTDIGNLHYPGMPYITRSNMIDGR